MSEYQPSPEDLRARAAINRRLAAGARSPTKAKEYYYIADVFDREADALEKLTTTNEQRRSV